MRRYFRAIRKSLELDCIDRIVIIGILALGLLFCNNILRLVGELIVITIVCTWLLLMLAIIIGRAKEFIDRVKMNLKEE
ncbi:hypothetical protein [Clostridium perfringens]|uniref:hypothetical protein n=1 Tax=Clostridium perfringens TaxID=1502 RepID=UPI0023412CAB|nr:hypothetical protein [Clostridium perfringens]MDC4245653.1 hypothetical protein [Clostridium perfringens]